MRGLQGLKKVIGMLKSNDTYTFVELNRTFHELSNDPNDTDNIQLRRTLHLAKPLTWADLTSEFRVIVLSEAGAGKTQEIRHFAERLRAVGKAAFFLRSNTFQMLSKTRLKLELLPNLKRGLLPAMKVGCSWIRSTKRAFAIQTTSSKPFERLDDASQ